MMPVSTCRQIPPLDKLEPYANVGPPFSIWWNSQLVHLDLLDNCLFTTPPTARASGVTPETRSEVNKSRWDAKRVRRRFGHAEGLWGKQ